MTTPLTVVRAGPGSRNGVLLELSDGGLAKLTGVNTLVCLTFHCLPRGCRHVDAARAHLAAHGDGAWPHPPRAA
jgi:hypothetical protein